MYKLNYDPLICKGCKTIDCLVKCQYQDFKDINRARDEKNKILNAEYSTVLDDCRTCYGCEEYCPNNNHPFYQIVELQEKLNIKNVPDPIFKQQLRMMGPKNRIKTQSLKPPIIDMCLFPQLIDNIKGKLYEGASIIWGGDIFCNIMWLHCANMSVILDRLPKMIQNIYEYYIKQSETDEIICFHDECYGAFTQLAPAYGIDVPFKPVHIFEYISKKLDELKLHIKPLNQKIAYQRPCSNRLCSDMDEKLDEIFHKIGAIRVKRTYDKNTPLCCGSVLRIQQKDREADEIQRENISDMKGTGARIAVFNCPMCMMTLGEEIAAQGLFPLHVSDLVRHALGEI